MFELSDRDRLARIEQILSDLSHRLYGNGQPGEIEVLRGRVSKLENITLRAVTIITAAAFLFNVLSGSGILSLETFLGRLNTAAQHTGKP